MIRGNRLLWCSLVFVCLLLTAVGCRSSQAVKPPPPSSSTTDHSKNVSEPGTERLDSPAAGVLYRYAELVSKGDIPGAVALLGPNLKNGYNFKDYAPLRNTPKMEIVKMVERTGDRQPDLGSRNAQADAWAIFGVAVRYRVLGIIPSDFIDGEIFYHQATVVKFTGTDNWVITGMGTGPHF